jgi:hypothetical protein
MEISERKKELQEKNRITITRKIIDIKGGMNHGIL